MTRGRGRTRTRTVSCLLINSEKKFMSAVRGTFSVEASPSSTIQTLKERIKDYLHNTLRKIDAMSLIVWKYSIPESDNPQPDFKSIRIIGDGDNFNRLLKDIFDRHPVEELRAEEKVADLPENRSLLIEVPDASEDRPADMTHLVHPPKEDKSIIAVTFRIKRIGATQFDWGDAAKRLVVEARRTTEGSEQSVRSELPSFISSIVHKKRRPPANMVPEQETFFQYCIEIHGEVNLRRDVVNAPGDALPYAHWGLEMFHYLHVLNYVEFQGPTKTRRQRMSLAEAHSVVLQKFMEYWLHKTGASLGCTLNQPSPFPLIAKELEEGGSITPTRTCKYRPKPDFALVQHSMPRFLVEFDSSENRADEHRLLIQMACTFRLACTLSGDEELFLMGVFFTKERDIHRYFVYGDKTTQDVKYHKETWKIDDAEHLTRLLFEFYNYAEHVTKETSDSTKKEETEIADLTRRINENYQSLMTRTKKRTHQEMDGGDEGPAPGPSTGGQRWTNAMLTDAVHGHGLRLKADDVDDDDLFSPLVEASVGRIVLVIGANSTLQLPSHILECKTADGQPVIVKIVRKDSKELAFLRELSLLKKSPHNHVIPLLTHVEWTSGLLIVLPWAQPLPPNLSILLPETDFGQLSRELVEGVAFLHRQKIAHNDIKLDNLLLYHCKHLYIIDFELATRCKDVEQKFEMSCGTPGWTAPEIVLDDSKPLRPFSPIRADLWACGKVLGHFALVCKDEDPDIKLLRMRLTRRDPSRRPLLHEVVDEERDFWSSRRLRWALVYGDNGQYPPLPGGSARLKRARGDISPADEAAPAPKSPRSVEDDTASSRASTVSERSENYSSPGPLSRNSTSLTAPSSDTESFEVKDEEVVSVLQVVGTKDAYTGEGNVQVPFERDFIAPERCIVAPSHI